MSKMDDNIRGLLTTYRNAVQDQVRMKYVLALMPDIERQIDAPLMARQDSRVQAAEITLMACIKRLVSANG